MDLQPTTGNTTHTNPANLTHYPALDGLRGVAFGLVMLTHYYQLPWGFGGVNFFFVLSGFLITGILYDTRDRPDRVRRFYVRRALRIFPLYYGVFVLVLLLQPWMKWDWSWPWLAWPLYLGNFLRLWGRGSPAPVIRYVAWGQLLSLVHPKVLLFFGHFWSLCVEEQFYLLWPWVVFFLRSRRRLMAICLGVVCVAPLLRSVAQHQAPEWMNKMQFSAIVGVPFQLDALLLGALLALLWRGSHRETMQKLASWTLGFLTSCAVLYAVHAVRSYPPHTFRKLYQYPDWLTTWDLSLLNLYGAVLLLCALRPGALTYRMLNWSGLRYVGRISYGAYVFHDIPHTVYLGWVLAWQRQAHFSNATVELLTLGVAFGMTMLLASLSFRFFETPFLNLKERWAPSARYESKSAA